MALPGPPAPGFTILKIFTILKLNNSNILNIFNIGKCPGFKILKLFNFNILTIFNILNIFNPGPSPPPPVAGLNRVYLEAGSGVLI